MIPTLYKIRITFNIDQFLRTFILVTFGVQWLLLVALSYAVHCPLSSVWNGNASAFDHSAVFSDRFWPRSQKQGRLCYVEGTIWVKNSTWFRLWRAIEFNRRCDRIQLSVGVDRNHIDFSKHLVKTNVEHFVDGVCISLKTGRSRLSHFCQGGRIFR